MFTINVFTINVFTINMFTINVSMFTINMFTTNVFTINVFTINVFTINVFTINVNMLTINMFTINCRLAFGWRSVDCCCDPATLAVANVPVGSPRRLGRYPYHRRTQPPRRHVDAAAKPAG